MSRKKKKAKKVKKIEEGEEDIDVIMTGGIEDEDEKWDKYKYLSNSNPFYSTQIKDLEVVDYVNIKFFDYFRKIHNILNENDSILDFFTYTKTNRKYSDIVITSVKGVQYYSLKNITYKRNMNIGMDLIIKIKFKDSTLIIYGIIDGEVEGKYNNKIILVTISIFNFIYLINSGNIVRGLELNLFVLPNKSFLNFGPIFSVKNVGGYIKMKNNVGTIKKSEFIFNFPYYNKDFQSYIFFLFFNTNFVHYSFDDGYIYYMEKNKTDWGRDELVNFIKSIKELGSDILESTKNSIVYLETLDIIGRVIKRGNSYDLIGSLEVPISNKWELIYSDFINTEMLLKKTDIISEKEILDIKLPKTNFRSFLYTNFKHFYGEVTEKNFLFSVVEGDKKNYNKIRMSIAFSKIMSSQHYFLKDSWRVVTKDLYKNLDHSKFFSSLKNSLIKMDFILYEKLIKEVYGKDSNSINLFFEDMINAASCYAFYNSHIGYGFVTNDYYERKEPKNIKRMSDTLDKLKYQALDMFNDYVVSYNFSGKVKKLYNISINIIKNYESHIISKDQLTSWVNSDLVYNKLMEYSNNKSHFKSICMFEIEKIYEKEGLNKYISDVNKMKKYGLVRDIKKIDITRYSPLFIFPDITDSMGYVKLLGVFNHPFIKIRSKQIHLLRSIVENKLPLYKFHTFGSPFYNKDDLNNLMNRFILLREKIGEEKFLYGLNYIKPINLNYLEMIYVYFILKDLFDNRHYKLLIDVKNENRLLSSLVELNINQPGIDNISNMFIFSENKHVLNMVSELRMLYTGYNDIRKTRNILASYTSKESKLRRRKIKDSRRIIKEGEGMQDEGEEEEEEGE